MDFQAGLKYQAWNSSSGAGRLASKKVGYSLNYHATAVLMGISCEGPTLGEGSDVSLPQQLHSTSVTL